MKLQAFLYRPVNSARKEIRLLVVQPHKDRTAPIHCAVEHVSLLDDPNLVYETVSYVWGDSRQQTHITVDGKLLRLSKSVELCLRYLRYPDEQRTLWIDAACINQTDPDEKADQVSIMDKIYRQSMQSVVWLGEEDEQTADAAKQARAMLKEMYETEDYGKILRHHHSHTVTTSEESERSVSALCDLFDRPWFGRLWVIQEVALAPRSSCLCGGFEFITVDLLRLAVWLVTQVSTGRGMSAGMRSAMQMQQHCDKIYGRHLPEQIHWKSQGIDALLKTASIANCSNPRDRVFGILGLVKGDNDVPIPSLLRPDYRKAVDRVFHDATRYIYHRMESLGHLRNICHRDSGDLKSRFSTWSTRWDRAYDWNFDPVSLACEFDASSGLPAGNFDESSDGTTLHLVGCRVCTVSWCKKTMTHRQLVDRKRFFAMYRDVLGRALEARQGICSQGVTWKALVCTLVCEQLISFDRARKDDIYRAAIGYFASLRCSAKSTYCIDVQAYVKPNAHDSMKAASEFQVGLLSGWNNRRFFITDDGALGMGPKVMQRSDIVAVVAGVKIPVILRPFGPKFKYVGEAYVHGIMDGEIRGAGLERIDVV